MGAENPTLYDVLDISTLTYSDFDCVYLIGDEVVGIIVNKDSKYNSFSELIEDALANPGQVKLSTLRVRKFSLAGRRVDYQRYGSNL